MWQPDGVHHASAIYFPDEFAWTDQDWKGIAREELVFYELHVGTFSTRRDFFDAIIGRLEELSTGDYGPRDHADCPVPGVNGTGVMTEAHFCTPKQLWRSCGAAALGRPLPTGRPGRDSGCRPKSLWSRRKLHR